jgi:transglutaminase-like putative cysteine protease
MSHVAPTVVRERRRLEPQTLAVTHETIYRYTTPVTRSQHQFLLRPLQDDLQQLLDYRLSVSPEVTGVEFEDLFGNRARRVLIDQTYQELRIETHAVVRLAVPPVDPPALHPALLPYPWTLWQRHMMSPFLLPPDLPEEELQALHGFALDFSERQKRDLVRTLTDINSTIHAEFRYLTGSTSHTTTPYDVYLGRTGVCQDFTNLFICLARLLGVPARYRVGYIYTGGRDYGNNAQSEATHAWAEVFLPEIGWRGFDPTNGCTAGPDHVRVACGRDAPDATPTSGSYQGGTGETLSVKVRVERVG